MTRIVFAACGSIGHIAPCVAIAKAVKSIDPSSAVHFACSTRKEDGDFLHDESLPFTEIGGRSAHLLSLPMEFMRAWKLLGDVKPDVILTKGGGVTIPIALAGWMKGIPIVTHESDSVPGRGTRFISHFAVKSINGFAEGNPLRPGITNGSRERGLVLTGLKGDRPILLVTGGSQGAQALNEAIIQHADALLEFVDIVHITGSGKRGIEGERNGYWKSEFVHNDLENLYAIANIALSRSGAGNVGELAANGIPTILVPLEGLAQNHQVKNAEMAERSGGCILLKQDALQSELVAIVHDLAEHPEKRRMMSEKIRTLHKPQADVAVANILLAISHKHSGVS